MEPRKILVVDDDRDVKMILDMLLHLAGYDLVNAYDGAEAVEQFRRHRPDLVLMDIQMPVMTGDAAIREILAIDPGARLIAVTAYDYSEEALGVPVLRKGFHKDEFLRCIEEAIAG